MNLMWSSERIIEHNLWNSSMTLPILVKVSKFLWEDLEIEQCHLPPLFYAFLLLLGVFSFLFHLHL